MEISSPNGDPWVPLCTIPLPCPSSLVSPRKEFVHSSGTPAFVAAAQRIPLHCLALVASGAYCGSYRVVTDPII